MAVFTGTGFGKLHAICSRAHRSKPLPLPCPSLTLATLIRVGRRGFFGVALQKLPEEHHGNATQAYSGLSKNFGMHPLHLRLQLPCCGAPALGEYPREGINCQTHMLHAPHEFRCLQPIEDELRVVDTMLPPVIGSLRRPSLRGHNRSRLVAASVGGLDDGGQDSPPWLLLAQQALPIDFPGDRDAVQAPHRPRHDAQGYLWGDLSNEHQRRLSRDPSSERFFDRQAAAVIGLRSERCPWLFGLEARSEHQAPPLLAPDTR